MVGYDFEIGIGFYSGLLCRYAPRNDGEREVMSTLRALFVIIYAVCEFNGNLIGYVRTEKYQKPS